MAKLDIPPYFASKGTADISREGLAPSTTDSVLGTAGSNDVFGENNNTPTTPYMPRPTELPDLYVGKGRGTGNSTNNGGGAHHSPFEGRGDSAPREQRGKTRNKAY